MHLQDLDAPIFVAGHRGLVGSAVLANLREAGYRNLIVRTRDELDLRDASAVFEFFKIDRPNFVVMAAARVGGILANKNYPADFLSENLAIELATINAAHATGVGERGRFVFLGSSCIYPKHAPQPMREEHLLSGPLEPTNDAYAIAKIAGLKLAEAYHRQHGDDFVSLMPTNLYGPGDNFDLASSHVLPALMRKFHEAKGAAGDGTDAAIPIWGSGLPRREFLFSRDLADAVRFVLELPEDRLRSAAPDGLLNVGVGQDIAISELALLVREVVGSTSSVVYDNSKPDGAPRKLLDVSRLMSIGWSATTPLSEGLAKTYRWYQSTLMGEGASVN